MARQETEDETWNERSENRTVQVNYMEERNEISMDSVGRETVD